MSNQWLERVKNRARELDMSLEEVARVAGLDRSYFRKIAGRAGAAPRGGTLKQIASALETRPEAIVDQYPGPEASINKSPSESSVSVPELTAKGLLVDPSRNVPVPGQNIWGIPSNYLKYTARVPDHAANILEVIGDTMMDPASPNAAGSLSSGDMVLIDSSDKIPSPPGTFAMWDGLGIIFKMIEAIPGAYPTKVRISCRNPIYHPYECTLEDANIIGRVKIRISIY